MKIIKPIVGISKIIDHYDAVVCGFDGVLYDGAEVNSEGVEALRRCAELGKKSIIITNSFFRVREIINILRQGKSADISFLNAIVSAGEILHYQLKNPLSLGLSGKKYYNLGGTLPAMFEGLDYKSVAEIEQADFVFIGKGRTVTETIADYIPQLEHACALNLPLLCIGNDVATYLDGEVSIGAGGVAEQYAVLGGKIITCGKPNIEVLNYAVEGFGRFPKKMLFVGDSFATDIKSGNLLNADTLLISKGIHVNFLGEGYIPDIEKVRDLATNFDAYPDYVASGLRW